MNIPIFIPHYGCPNGCVFCNQRKISGHDTIQNMEEIKLYIEDSIKTVKERELLEIAFFGGSFTGLDWEVQKAYLSMADEFVHRYHLRGIRISTRPDYINKEVLSRLKNYSIKAIELGVQSLNEEVLIASKRNHSVDDVSLAVELIHAEGIELGLQMMIGLPKDTFEASLETAKKMIKYQPRTIRIYPTLVIKDTQLYTMYQQGLYQPLTIDDAVMWTSKILPLFTTEDIIVLRVGLQSNDGLNQGLAVAGPYHPAFKELVLDEIIYQAIHEKVMEPNMRFPLRIQLERDEYVLITYTLKEVHLMSQERTMQRLMGHKKKNHQRFLELFRQKCHDHIQVIYSTQDSN